MKIGDQIPAFELDNQDGIKTNSSDLIGSPVLIYFYPKDDTPGCTKEACSFRDSFEDFVDLGCKVYGISGDSIASHLAFKNKHRLPFDLLSDKGNLVRKKFKVPTNLLGLIPGRVTYIFDSEGKLIHMINSQLNFNKHVAEGLNIIRNL